MSEEFDFHPQKPVLPKKESKSGWRMTLLSLILFIASFLLLFSDQIQFLIFLVVVLFIHEMGHFIFMKFFNYKEVKMMFVPLMGAFVQGVKSRYSQKEIFFVVLEDYRDFSRCIGSVFAVFYHIPLLLELSGILCF